MARQILEPEQKALEINLDDKIYGTFAEIGAGQEVARHFFQVGAAAGTIAKTMSAYDKIYSDAIYGVEGSGRYVCESRLYKMLDHEYDLMNNRLQQSRPDTCFFVFADTVAAINYTRTIKGDGWLGCRFQLDPDGAPNEIVLHVKLKDQNNTLQQQAIGILGVNLLYGCYKYSKDPDTFIQSLQDNLEGRIKIDMMRMTGPDFRELDNRLLSLLLVKNNLCDVAMFDASGKNIHASEFLYKKNLLVVRGSYRPTTLVNMDMMKTGFAQFKNEAEVDPSKSFLIAEITMDNLLSDGKLNEQDFLDRAELLNSLGYMVMVSNCTDHRKIIHYFSDYKVKFYGFVVGVRELLNLINEKYYQNLDGQLLAAFGKLFMRNVKLYVYPAMQEGSAELMNAHNLPIPNGIKFLYKHLLDSDQIVDLENYNPDILHIYSKEVLRMLRADEAGWENYLSSKVVGLIKEKCLFNYPCQRMEFEY